MIKEHISPNKPVKFKNLSDAKTNQDFNNQKPIPNSNLNGYDPNTEVPLIGDDDKEVSVVITMDKVKNPKKEDAAKKPESDKRIKERDLETKTEDAHP